MNKVTIKKKSLVIVIVTALIAMLISIICPFVFMFIPGAGDMIDKFISPEKFKVNEYSLQGEFKDTFSLKEQLITNYPDLYYKYDIYEVEGTSLEQRNILSLNKVRKIDNIKGVYNSENLKCYMISNYILFKQVNDDSFKVVSIYSLRDNEDSYSFLIPCLREMLTNSWEWIDIVSDFLIKSNDVQSINIIRRYADGNITDEEVKLNKASINFKEDIIRICKNKLS